MARISIELPDEVAARLTALAEARGISQDALVAELLGRDRLPQPDLEDEAAMAAWVAEGEADAAAGRTFSHEEVMAHLSDIIERAQARRGD
jgi:predicted transcriptional regulator